MLSDAAKQQLQAITERYLATLPEKRTELDARWANCVHNHFDQNSRRELTSLAHKLAGSAPSYRLDALGSAAQALDSALATIENHSADEARQRLEPLTDRLRTELIAAIAAQIPGS